MFRVQNTLISNWIKAKTMNKEPKQLLAFRKGNAKLDDRIYTFDLPAGHSCPNARICLAKANKFTGEITDGPDQEFRCFSATAERFESVRNMRWNNFELLRSKNEPEMIALITASLPNDASVIRLHVSGDFFNQEYTNAWMTVAAANPEILFYAYSKSVRFVTSSVVPDNMIVTFSIGGREDDLITDSMKTAQVVFSPDAAAELGLEIDHDDSHAMTKDGNFAVLLHSTQPAGSEAAEAIKKMRAEQVSFKYPRENRENELETTLSQFDSSLNMEVICNPEQNEIKLVNPSNLKQHPDNQRIYGLPKQLLVLAESMIKVGMLQPIIVNEKNEILCGWRRFKARESFDPVTPIQVIMVKLSPEDEAAFIVFSNTHRVKTALEKYHEAIVLKQHWGKKQGERTDLKTNISEEEKKSTRARIADAIGISETEIFKITTIGDKDQAMLELVGDNITLNEAYNAMKSDKPKHESPSEEIDLDTIHSCPFCGNMPKRIELDENNNLKYKDQ